MCWLRFVIVRGSRKEGVLDKDLAGLALVALPVGLVVLLSVQVVEVTIERTLRLHFFLPGMNSMDEEDIVV